MLSKIKTFVVSLAVAALCAIAIWVGFTMLAPGPSIAAEQDAATDDTAIPVRATPVAFLDEITIARAFPGQVEARQTSQIGFEFGGRVKEITADEGDIVQAGQILAALDTDILTAERNAMAARQQALAAQFDLAMTELERNERLNQNGNVANRVVQVAQAEVDRLTALTLEADAQMAQLDIQIEKSTLRAPFTGVVGARRADVGDTVAGGQALLNVFESGRAVFRVGLPPQLSPEMFRNVTVMIDEMPYPATLRAVRPDIDPATRSRTALFDIEGADAVTFGQQGTLEVEIAQDLNGIWVPQDAMRAGVGGIWTVLVADDADAVASVAIEVLHIGADRAFVQGAFREGDRLIIDGAHKVTPGQTVSVVD